MRQRLAQPTWIRFARAAFLVAALAWPIAPALAASGGHSQNTTTIVYVTTTSSTNPTVTVSVNSSNNAIGTLTASCTNPYYPTESLFCDPANPYTAGLPTGTIATAQGGTVTFSGTNILYTPKAGFSGADTVSFVNAIVQSVYKEVQTITVGDFVLGTNTVYTETSTTNTANYTINVGGSAPQASWTVSESVDPGQYTAAGQTLAYTYALTNTGSVAISGITVAGSKAGAASCPSTTLAAGASMTCTGSYGTVAGDVSGGSVVNTVTASGTPASGTLDAATAQATATFANRPGWLLGVSVAPSNFSAAGQTLTFTYTVVNNGNVDISAIALVDTKVSSVSCPSTTLAAGANMTCTGTYVTTSGDVTAHSIAESVTASGTVPSGKGTLTSATAQLSVAFGSSDSEKLRGVQAMVSQVEALASADALTGAVGAAVTEGFSDGGEPITAGPNGVRFNFAAEPQKSQRQALEDSSNGPFRTLAYNATGMTAPARVPREWLAWAEVRGSGWNTNFTHGDLSGGQVNGLAGVTRRLSPDLLVGVVTGYESFNYTVGSLDGRLRGNGWTLGTYLGWRITQSVRFDAMVAYSGVDYDGRAGAATGSFDGQRWIASSGLTGMYRWQGLEIEPSARVFGVWEHQGAYVDSFGATQDSRDFSTGRASVGAKIAYPWMTASGLRLSPYVGGYADYYFRSDNADLSALPAAYVDGWSARVASGMLLATADGRRMAIGGEVGGLGSGQFTNWAVRASVAWPFR